MSGACFYFRAQSGSIYSHKPLAPSNYYLYKLPGNLLWTVKQATNTARVTDTGLVYPPAFLAMIAKADLKCAQ